MSDQNQELTPLRCRGIGRDGLRQEQRAEGREFVVGFHYSTFPCRKITAETGLPSRSQVLAGPSAWKFRQADSAFF